MTTSYPPTAHHSLQSELAAQIAETRYKKAQFMAGWLQGAKEESGNSKHAIRIAHRKLFQNLTFQKMIATEEALETLVKNAGLGRRSFETKITAAMEKFIKEN